MMESRILRERIKYKTTLDFRIVECRDLEISEEIYLKNPTRYPVEKGPEKLVDI